MTLQIHTIVSQPFAENSYVVWLENQSEAVVIDPGFEPEVILDFLQDHGLGLAAILNTHGHVDHIAGNRALKEAYPDAPIWIGQNDANMLIDPDLNLSGGHGIPITSPPRDRALLHNDTFQLAGIDFECWDLPGHSPGHIVFKVQREPVLFGGDVLFQGSIGRTDFPGGSFEQLADGIRKKLYPLPDDTIIYPGHGPVTKVGHERRTNPFVPG